jgi:dTDP-4-amino-4,6-dideoxygalactose transaminase
MTFSEYLQSLGGYTYLYANASNGYKDLLTYLVTKSGKTRPNVVIPSYIPAKLYRASLAAGCDVRFYEVFGKCTFEVSRVDALIDENTVAVFYVHYFGIPHQIDEMATLAKRRGTILIEDCALTIAASYQGKALGTFGDAGLFSVRKTLLFAEGGILRVGEQFRDFKPKHEWRVRSCFSVQKYLKQKAKYVYVRFTRGADPLGLMSERDPQGYMDFSKPQELNVKQLSRFSERRLRFANLDLVVRKRRENFQYIAKRFPSSNILEPLHATLCEGCTPYSFPFLIKNGKRDDYRDFLWRKGIITGAGWPESPYDASSVRTKTLAESLLELSVHQLLTQQQVDRSLRCLEQLAKQSI